MTIKELRTTTGMTQKEFSEYFGIPIRTLQKWETGERTPPDYVVSLIERNLGMKVINATTIGNLISAHYEHDDEKFDSYVKFIIESYEEQGEHRKADIIRKRADGSCKNEPKVTMDDKEELGCRSSMPELLKGRITLTNPISDSTKITHGENLSSWRIVPQDYIGFYSTIVRFDEDVWLTRELKGSKYGINESLGFKENGEEYDVWNVYDRAFCKNTIKKGFIEGIIPFTETMDDGHQFSGTIRIYKICELHNNHYHGIVEIN